MGERGVLSTPGSSDARPWVQTLDWSECRALARAVARSPRGRRVRRRLRPPALSGLWRARAPLAVQLRVAAAQGRLVRMDGGARGVAVIEAPGRRRAEVSAELSTGRTTRVLHLLDRYWDPLVFAVVPMVLLSLAASPVVMPAVRPFGSGTPGMSLILVGLALGWVAVALAAGVVRGVVNALRSAERTGDHESLIAESRLVDTWSVAAFHVRDARDAPALHAEARQRIGQLWDALPPRLDDPRPGRHTVDLDAVTSQDAEQQFVDHPFGLYCSPQSTPRIAIIGDGLPDGARRPKLRGAQGITLFLVALGTVFLVAPLLVAARERAAVATGAESGLTSYGSALMWLVERFLWLGGGPRPASTWTVVLGWELRVAMPVVVLVVAAAVYRQTALTRAVDDAAEDALRGTARGLAPTVAVVTALPEEFVAVRAMLSRPRRGLPDHDGAHYLLGELPSAAPGRSHHVVVVQQDVGGTGVAAAAATNLLRSYPGVSQVIMSGIACGIPRPDDPVRHVRLGDIVVGTWGVISYDHVDERRDGAVLRGPQYPPSHLLLSAAQALQAAELVGSRPWEQWLEAADVDLRGFTRPPPQSDVLTTEDGDVVPHPARVSQAAPPDRPAVHYGLIGSADRSLRNAVRRDEIARPHGILALDMETGGLATAGFAQDAGWLAVRGISDYGDSRTTATWRRYAALASAAYVRAVLAEVAPLRPRGGQPLGGGPSRDR